MTTVRSLRSSRAGSLAKAGALAVLVLIAGTSLSAHRRDEYLQATRLAIDPERVEVAVDLTAGIAVADRILAEIDGDADGLISAAEGRVYSARLLSTIALDVDGVPLRVELVDSTAPGVEDVRKGEGTLRIRAVASLPTLPAGDHQLRYRNDHRPDVGAYLANTLVPTSSRVTVAAQRRDVDQRELIVHYTLRADRAIEQRQSMMVAFGGVLILSATLWWRRARTTERRDPISIL